MRVTVSTVVHLVDVLGGRKVEFEIEDGASVGDLLQVLAKRTAAGKLELLFADARGTLRPEIRVAVNGRSITFIQGLETTLQEGDEILLLPPLGGG